MTFRHHLISESRHSPIQSKSDTVHVMGAQKNVPKKSSTVNGVNNKSKLNKSKRL